MALDTSKIIHAPVGGGRYTVTSPIVKEDYGLYLKIEGLELPSTYEVDFSNSEHNGTSVTMIGNADGVLIPRQFITTGKDVFAFLYHVGADYGRTVYKFRIPNKLRPDRTNEEPTPEEQSVIDQAISALNTAVAQTAQDVIDADASAQSASQSAENAHDSAVDAQNYAETAQTSANNASASASQANTSATASAQSASQSAQIKADVEDLADDAQGYAQASAQSASASANSASQAQGYAQGASASAQSASGYASNAQTSANTASNKASEASTSASTASAKATESAQSATNAQGYAQTAEQAKTASQTAQGLAESARDSAVQAKTDAESARDDAVQAKEDAESAVASISGALIEKAPVITDTASGAIASFSDGANDLPLKSLIVDINPVQDLHGQDAPYPAGGGKNKFDVDNPNIVEGYISASSFNDGNYKAKTVYIAISPNTTYTVSKMEGKRFYIATSPNIPANNVPYSVRNVNNAATSLTITSGADDAYLWAWVYLQDTDTVPLNDMLASVQIEEGSTATDYAPYENICPISGWTEVDVEQSGKNIYNFEENKITTGNTTGGTVRAYYPLGIKGCTLSFSAYQIDSSQVSDMYINIGKLNNGTLEVFNSLITPNGVPNRTFTFSDDEEAVLIGSSTSPLTLKNNLLKYRIQVEKNDSVSEYSPYTGRSITIDLGQTVYGGKFDVLSGELVIDRAMVDLGTLDWTVGSGASSPSGKIFKTISNIAKPRERFTPNNVICTIYKTADQNVWFTSNYLDLSVGVENTGRILVRDDRYDNNVVAFKSAISGVQLVYELATPIEIQLSANQVNSLLGVNNIWADSGDTEVEYRADTKLFIERLTAPDSVDMIADANITSGQYFMVGNSLYKATANIANGSAIVVGTNCIRKSLSEALNEINA